MSEEKIENLGTSVPLRALDADEWQEGIGSLTKVQLQASIDIISPPPRVSPSQFADLYVFLPRDENAEPGKFHVSRRPHEAGMLDSVMDPSVREIFWMGASQAMGKTVCLIILYMYFIHQVKKSCIMIRPDIEAALNWNRDKFLPTVEATPCMAGLLVDTRKREGRSVTSNRRYPGGSMRLIGANSPSGFRSSSAPFVGQDEIDAFKENPEGDPCALGDRAAKTFSDAWLIKASTTTLEGMSRIHAGFKSGDQQLYFLPCLHCGHFQDLKTEQMKFSFSAQEISRFDPPPLPPKLGEKRKVISRGCQETKKSFTQIVNEHTWEIGKFPTIDLTQTIYVCEKCKHGWTDSQRIDAYMSGHPDNPPVIVNGRPLRAEWRATAPFEGIRSYGMNGMYMCAGLKKDYASYLHQFADDFLKAKRGGRLTLMTWTNTFKNEPFADISEKMEWQPLKDRSEDYGPELEPQAVVVLGSADVQQNPARIELKWIAFGPMEEAWVMDYEVVDGDLDMPDTQNRLAAHIAAKRFIHPYLGEIAPHSLAIDYGWQTKVKAVFAFCRKHRTCGSTKIFPTKGFPESMAALWEVHVDKNQGRIRKFYFNVDHFKSTIFDRLKSTEHGQCYIHIPKEDVNYVDSDGVRRKFKTAFNASYYMKLCSERRFPERQKDGTIKYRWKKVSESARNEPLDLMVYAFGLYETQKLGGWIAMQWAKVQRIMREKEEEKLKSSPKEASSPDDEQEQLSEQPIEKPVEKPAEGAKLPEARPPMRQMPKRLPQKRPMVKPTRPPWANRGFFNPLNL